MFFWRTTDNTLIYTITTMGFMLLYWHYGTLLNNIDLPHQRTCV